METKVVHLPSTSDNNFGKPQQSPTTSSSRRRHTGCICPLPARRGANIRPISGGYQANIRFCTTVNEKFLGPAQPDRPIANRSRIRRLLLHLSIAYCLHPKLDQTLIKSPIELSAMTRPKVPPDQRQRTAQACESCKRRKQKASSFSPRWVIQAANLTILILVFDITRALGDLLSSLLKECIYCNAVCSRIDVTYTAK